MIEPIINYEKALSDCSAEGFIEMSLIAIGNNQKISRRQGCSQSKSEQSNNSSFNGQSNSVKFNCGSDDELCTVLLLQDVNEPFAVVLVTKRQSGYFQWKKAQELIEEVQYPQEPIPCSICGDNLDDCIEPGDDLCATCVNYRPRHSPVNFLTGAEHCSAPVVRLIFFPILSRLSSQEVHYAKAA